jgi:hypothetical protein
MVKLWKEDAEFLEASKSEWFKAWKWHINASSWYFSYNVEVPWWQSFAEEEISQRFCQWCEDDMNELWIDEIDCTCTKEQYRKKVKRILDILWINADEGLKILNN